MASKKQPKKDDDQVILKVQVSRGEREEIEAAAKADRRSVSSFVALAALDRARLVR